MDISINAPAREGEANAAVCEYLSSLLGVRKAAVSLAMGGKSREKIISIQGVTAEEVVEKLAHACE